MGITIQGTVRGELTKCMNRAGDVCVSLDITFPDPFQKEICTPVRVVIVNDELCERVIGHIGDGTAVVISAHQLQVETFHDSGPRAVVIADDLQVAG